MSTTATNNYETVYILRSGISEVNAGAIHSKVDSVVDKFEGAVRARDDWGLRDLAYPINKETMGRYNVVVYTGNAGVVEEIERHFKISNDVIRFLTVRVEAEYDYGAAKKTIAAAEEEVRRIREAKKKGP